MIKFPDDVEPFSGEPALQVFNTSEIEIPLDDVAHQEILDLVKNTENAGFRFVEVVYVDLNEIKKINREHLKRDYITDIISFRYDDAPDYLSVEGTLYCCSPRIVEQAEEYGYNLREEFSRIFIHGLLHLIGYEDQTAEDKRIMTGREDHYLRRLGL